jgi:NADH:ubiquinone oxidoreductase subunit K
MVGIIATAAGSIAVGLALLIGGYVARRQEKPYGTYMVLVGTASAIIGVFLLLMFLRDFA